MCFIVQNALQDLFFPKYFLMQKKKCHAGDLSCFAYSKILEEGRSFFFFFSDETGYIRLHIAVIIPVFQVHPVLMLLAGFDGLSISIAMGGTSVTRPDA